MDSPHSHLPAAVDDQSSPITGTPQPANIANAFARRLHALFPSTQSPSASAIPNDSTPSSQRRESLPPRFLKVRIVTWNMHDSLPKGDLTELLGEVPVYKPEHSNDPLSTSIPPLPTDGKHPYHLVVISGQECPTSSGLPMGLGAGFKLKDKEKEITSSTDSEPDLASIPYGWTAILEDWLSHAGGSNLESPQVGGNKPCGANSEPQGLVAPNLKRRISTKAALSQKGPYEILIKERMMGLYLAVYIHREIKHLVQGLSKSSVTTGLIGGRVGNKGGLGISVNLDGTTLLFVNAHLAAHEGKLQHRLNDLAKIKSELAVDDFLANDDPRSMGEDLTDRFDYTFLFGDLNFRLDISRLHADWLISRRDYAQALCFDQLRMLMEHRDAFVGFNEADINFPPTFKYDVLRTLKRPKAKSVRSAQHDYPLAVNPLMEEPEIHVDDVDADVESGDVYGDNDDTGSLASSNTASLNYRQPPEQEPPEDEYFSRTHVLWASTGNLVQKVKTMAAAQKAKTKRSPRSVQSSLLSNNKSISSPMLSPGRSKWADELKKSSREGLGERKTATSPLKTTHIAPTLDASSTKSSTISKSIDRSLPGPPHSRTSQSKSASDEEAEEDRGVYDSSSKQRVPSWCDRILWKSTVEPGPDSDHDEPEALHPKAKTRVGQFFASFMRYRKSSHSSSTSSEVSNYGHPSSVPSRDDRSTPSQSAPGSPVIPVDEKDSTQFSQFDTPEISEVVRSGAGETANFANVGRALGVGLRSFSVDQAHLDGKGIPKHRRPSRTWTTPAKPRLSTEPVPTTTFQKDDQVVKNGASRRRLLPFFRGDSTNATAPADPASNPGEPTEITTSPTTRRPRKGDVVCLGYDSLDDIAMRRLEGRSDHRPVVGSFAIYL